MRWNNAHSDGAINIEENVPANKPIIIGNANIRISRTPIMAIIPIMINVVIVVFIERNNVSLTDLFAISSADIFFA